MHQLWVGSDRLKNLINKSLKLFIEEALIGLVYQVLSTYWWAAFAARVCTAQDGHCQWQTTAQTTQDSHYCQQIPNMIHLGASNWDWKYKTKWEWGMSSTLKSIHNALIYCTVNCKRRTANVMISSECITHDYICSQSLSKVSMTYNQAYIHSLFWWTAGIATQLGLTATVKLL